jgi:hypothetical protein
VGENLSERIALLELNFSVSSRIVFVVEVSVVTTADDVPEVTAVKLAVKATPGVNVIEGERTASSPRPEKRPEFKVNVF